FETRQALLATGKGRRQNFDRHFTIHRVIVSAIHLTHSAFAKMRADLVPAEFGARCNHRKFLIKTRSSLSIPRETAKCFWSGDSAQSEINSELNRVSCLAGPPSIARIHILSTPAFLNEYINVCSSTV